MKTLTTTLFSLFLFLGYSQDKTTVQEYFMSYDAPYLYPNPATNEISVVYGYAVNSINYNDSLGYTIDSEGVWVDFENQGTIDIFSIDGQQALTTIKLSKQTYTIDIPIHELRSGVYMVAIKFDDDTPIVKKVVKR